MVAEALVEMVPTKPFGFLKLKCVLDAVLVASLEKELVEVPGTAWIKAPEPVTLVVPTSNSPVAVKVIACVKVIASPAVPEGAVCQE